MFGVGNASEIGKQKASSLNIESRDGKSTLQTNHSQGGRIEWLDGKFFGVLLTFMSEFIRILSLLL